MIAHREELALTDEQISRFRELDADREKADAAVRQAARPPGTSNPGAAGAGPNAAAANNSGMYGAYAGGNGGRGMGGRGMGGGGMRGGGRRGGRGGGGERGPREGEIQQAIDDDDTKAYFDADALMTDAQREKARPIAQAQREQLWSYREALKRWRSLNEAGDAKEGRDER